MAGRNVTKISYYEIVRLISPNTWRCHVYTSDGSHYEGEAYSKDEARGNAMDVKRAND